MNDYVRIFDTTLRDGEQSPGATMTSAEKLEVGRALSRLGVDIIEAGFPAASPDDFAAVRTLAETVGSELVEGRPVSVLPVICALARTSKNDIDLAWEAVRPARSPRIHTFLATSPVHREHKLRMSTADVLARVKEMVAHAKSRCDDIEFSPEDAGRTEPEFLYEVLDAAIRAGATTLNIPDTVGYTVPDEYGALIAGIKANVPGIENVIISVHCHDDLGLAVANSLAGIRAGARQAEVTINGIGERAGNSALEEVVMTLKTRKAIFGLETNIDSTELCRVSRLVRNCTGMVVQPNKAIVGANAFAHEAGIHQDGVLKNSETYEIMRPETVGAAKSQLVLGKHSGRHAFQVSLAALGHALEGAALEEAFASFKKLADRKKNITEADLEALFRTTPPPELFALDALQVGCGTLGLSTATVRLRCPNGDLATHAATGTGPVDAVYKAIDALVSAPATLLEYSVRSVTEGIDALGEVSVRVRGELSGIKLNPQYGVGSAQLFHGHSADTDIVVASAKAYLGALNRVLLAVSPEASVTTSDKGREDRRMEAAS